MKDSWEWYEMLSKAYSVGAGRYRDGKCSDRDRSALYKLLYMMNKLVGAYHNG